MQFNMNTYQEQWAIIPEKKTRQTGDRGGGNMEFPRVLKNVEIPGANLKRSGISTEVFTKN